MHDYQHFTTSAKHGTCKLMHLTDITHVICHLDGIIKLVILQCSQQPPSTSVAPGKDAGVVAHATGLRSRPSLIGYEMSQYECSPNLETEEHDGLMLPLYTHQQLVLLHQIDTNY